jgi:hypothetical protein
MPTRLLCVLAFTLCNAPLWAEPEVAVNMLESEPLFEGGVQFYVSHRNNYAARTWRGSSVVPNREGHYTVDHKFGLGVNWGVPREIPGEWTLSAVMPLVLREFRAQVGDRNVTGRAGGFGDFALGARMRYLWWVPGDDTQRGGSLSLAAILELPTGRSNQELAGTPVPKPLQPGAGGASLTFAHIAAYSDNRLELIGTSWLSFRTFHVGRTGYNFGDQFGHELELKYRVIQEPFPGNTMFLALALNYEFTDADHDDGRKVSNTGRSAIALKPKIQWHPRPSWELKAIFTVPLINYVIGTQLVNELSYRFSVAWRF